MSEVFIKRLQEWVAKVSISPSTVRGMEKGTMKKAITYLSKLDLSEFGECHSSLDFNELLDKETEGLANKLPKIKGKKNWGGARKCINIFLRDAFYNHNLREQFSLSDLESWFEVPLDSHVGKALRRIARKEFKNDKNNPPSWGTIIGLSNEANWKYQAFAEKVANSHPKYKHLQHKVHLDVEFWRAKIIDHGDKVA